MKNITFLKLKLFCLMCLAVVAFSCEETVKVVENDEAVIQTNDEAIVYVINDQGKRNMASFEFRDQGNISVYLGLSKNANEEVTAEFVYDESILESYNNLNDTEYKLFPKASTTFQSDIVIAKGKNKSAPISITVGAIQDAEVGESYVLPFKAVIKTGNVKLSKEESNYLVFVKDLTKLPSCEKESGMKVVSCMEVNDTNPLNNLCFTLKNSGKPLIDIVILFSSNVNYNNETGKVFVYHNPNVQHLLDNCDKYLKPLQDRGIKVVLGLLGNHDRSGIANLAPPTAKSFAQEVKALCDSYHLDGIFVDDEYSAYQTPPPPGFTAPSSQSASRLCYEVKKLMPDRLVIAYAYGRTRSLPDVNGEKSGTFVDYGLHDYGGSSDLNSNYPDMPKMNMGLYSQEFNRGYWTSKSNLEWMRANGYGTHMIFAMDPLRNNFSRQKAAMEDIAEAFYDDELVYDGKPHSKDW